MRASLADLLSNPEVRIEIVTADTAKEEDVKRVCARAREVSCVALKGRALCAPSCVRSSVADDMALCVCVCVSIIAFAFSLLWQMDPPVRHVFHAAGVSVDMMLYEVTEQTFRDVGDCKCKAAWWLHEVSVSGSQRCARGWKRKSKKYQSPLRTCQTLTLCFRPSPMYAEHAGPAHRDLRRHLLHRRPRGRARHDG